MKAQCVGAHFALVHHALLVRVHVFDGVLYGYDVVILVLVEIVDHRGQRGGFAGTRRAGDQQQALGHLHHLVDHGREVQFLEGLVLAGNGADGRAYHAALAVGVHAQPAHAFYAEGEVELVGGLEALALRVGHQREDEGLAHFRGELFERGGQQLAVYAQHRRGPGRKVEVRRVLLVHHHEQLAHCNHWNSSSKTFKKSGS